jgi:hypothetical protein
MATEVKLREIFKASLEDDPAVFTKCKGSFLWRDLIII